MQIFQREVDKISEAKKCSDMRLCDTSWLVLGAGLAGHRLVGVLRKGSLNVK